MEDEAAGVGEESRLVAWHGFKRGRAKELGEHLANFVARLELAGLVEKILVVVLGLRLVFLLELALVDGAEAGGGIDEAVRAALAATIGVAAAVLFGDVLFFRFCGVASEKVFE